MAYHGDLNNNISWGTIAYENGLNGFYGSSDARDWPYSPPNQPPLTILMFTGLRMMWQTVENVFWWFNNHIAVFPSATIWFWEQKGMVLLVKLPSILADLGIGYLIYWYLTHNKKFKTHIKTALLISCIWLFNPITWYNSAIWGQTDSIVNLLGLISILLLLKKKLIASTTFFALSLLFKGSLAVFSPILLFVALSQKYALKEWLLAIIYPLLITVLVSLMFHPHFDFPIWFINLYKDRILPGEIGYLTANGFNFWWLVNPGKVYDSISFLGIPARLLGFIFTFVGVGGTLLWIRNKVTEEKVLISLVLTALISFLFLTRIHERYLYPFFPIATLLLSLFPQILVPYLILSLTHLLNLYNLFWAPSFTFLETFLKIPLVLQILSVVNLLTLFFILRQLRSSKL